MIRSLITRFRNRTSDNVLSHSSQYFVFFIGITLLNLIYRKYLSATLPDFGGFTTLLSFYNILFTPFGMIGLYITKKMAYYNEHKMWDESYSLHRSMQRLAFVLLGAVMLGTLIFTPRLVESYQLYSVFPILLIILKVIFSVINNTYMAALQAENQFVKIGSINIVNGLVRMAMGVLAFEVLVHLTAGKSLTHFISGYNLALGTYLAGVVCMMALAMYFFYKRRKPRFQAYKPEAAFHWKDFAHELLPIFVLMLLYGFLRNIDESLVRSLFSKDKSSDYGALITVGKTSAFLITSIVFVIFPKISSKVHDAVSSRRIMLKGILLCFLSFLPLFGAAVIMPEFIMQVLTSSRYLEVAPLVKWFLLAFFPFSMMLIFVNFFIAHKSYWFIVMLGIFAGLEVGLIHLFHDTFTEVILAIGISGYLLLASVVLYWWQYLKRIPGAEKTEKAEET